MPLREGEVHKLDHYPFRKIRKSQEQKEGVHATQGGGVHKLDHYPFRKIRKSQDFTHTKIKFYIIFI